MNQKHRILSAKEFILNSTSFLVKWIKPSSALWIGEKFFYRPFEREPDRGELDLEKVMPNQDRLRVRLGEVLAASD